MNSLELLKSRKSVRSYTPEKLPRDIISKLKAEITMTNTHEQGFRFQLITDDPDPMRSVSKSYGSFKNPSNYLAAVVDTAAPDIFERAGYFAERFVVKATSLGLATCFVGSTFNESLVKAQLRAGEKILFIVLVGYAAEKERVAARMMSKLVHLRSRSAVSFFHPEKLFAKALERCPYLKEGLEGIAVAPSALNRQPVRVRMMDGEDSAVPCAGVRDTGERTLIDLGIAKYNFNFVTSTVCEWGNWAPLVLI